MMLAEEMKKLSSESRENSSLLNKYWEEITKEIRKSAEEGKNELCPYYLKCWQDYDNRDLLIKKIEDNGFRLVEGWQIGKPMCNSRTKYIIW